MLIIGIAATIVFTAISVTKYLKLGKIDIGMIFMAILGSALAIMGLATVK